MVSILKRKSSLVLILVTIVLLLLLPLWYLMIAPSIITSELEKIDQTISYEGIFGKKSYLGTYIVINRSGVWEIPVHVDAHAYVREVKGDNIILNVDVTMTRDENGKALPSPFSRDSTYVFNKFTMENVVNAPEADKNRTGHDPFYPSHLAAEKNISNAWLDNLNATATLEYRGSTKEEGLELYEYFVNKTITKMLWIEELEKTRNCTLISTKTIMIEPLSGLHVYTKNETFSWTIIEPSKLPLVYLTYKSTADSKADGLATAKTAYEGLQLLEVYVPTILGVVIIILIVGLAFNLRRLGRKLA